MNTLERIQYNAALVITGSWKGTNLNRIYDELGWDSLNDRCWCRCLFHFYKIQNNLTPPYLKDPIPPIRSHLFGSLSANVINEIRYKSKSYSSFYPDSIRCWNEIGQSYVILQTLSPLSWLFQLRVGLSPLYANKNNHNFSDIPCDKCDICKHTENLEKLFPPLHTFYRN